MPSPTERTSRADLNGAACPLSLPGQRNRFDTGYVQLTRPGTVLRGYNWAELSERVDVNIATLRHWVLAGYFQPARRLARAVSQTGNQTGNQMGTGPVIRTGVGDASSSGAPEGALARRGGVGFAAVDVVRLEVLARLVRSGVPLARAAELVRTTE